MIYSTSGIVVRKFQKSNDSNLTAILKRPVPIKAAKLANEGEEPEVPEQTPASQPKRQQ